MVGGAALRSTTGHQRQKNTDKKNINISPLGHPYEGLTGNETNPDGKGGSVQVFPIDKNDFSINVDSFKITFDCVYRRRQEKLRREIYHLVGRATVVLFKYDIVIKWLQLDDS